MGRLNNERKKYLKRVRVVGLESKWIRPITGNVARIDFHDDLYRDRSIMDNFTTTAPYFLLLRISRRCTTIPSSNLISLRFFFFFFLLQIEKNSIPSIYIHTFTLYSHISPRTNLGESVSRRGLTSSSSIGNNAP